MKNYVAIGIPAGQISGNSNPMFIHKGHLMTMSAAHYRIWYEFLNINSYERVVEKINKEMKVIKGLFNQLLDARFIVSVDEIMTHVPYRCGVGLGYDSSSNDFVIYTGSNIHYPQLSYLIWCGSNANNTFSTIISDINATGVRIDDSIAHKAVYTLIRRGAVHISE